MSYLPVTSREKVRVSYGVDMSMFAVEVAVVLASEGEPGDSDYHPTTWDGLEAVLLVGKDSTVPLPAGEYVVWGRFEAGDEQPVRRFGTLTVGTP